MPKKFSIRLRIIAIFGAVSASLGGIGAAISGFGLCACVLAPFFSVVGIVSIIMGFLARNSVYFFAVGAFLLAVSFILHKKSKVCKIHKK